MLNILSQRATEIKFINPAILRPGGPVQLWQRAAAAVFRLKSPTYRSGIVKEAGLKVEEGLSATTPPTGSLHRMLTYGKGLMKGSKCLPENPQTLNGLTAGQNQTLNELAAARLEICESLRVEIGIGPVFHTHTLDLRAEFSLSGSRIVVANGRGHNREAAPSK
ncbi:hypothetical protein EYF80_044701 [Liparis tanakae]|uniref:Uncharacterized protein n=1 Tax=Liparis tanakae TaxID=230148 RepID=A0A4Z2FUZ7_9TELE|nr:hypothetical protein EYF80_044701 [Liparis tanakae]